MKKVHTAEIDSGFVGKSKSGQLIINVVLTDVVPQEVMDSPEAKVFSKETGTDADTMGFMKIDISIKVGDLTENEIMGCDPKEYLNNGMIAGLLEAISTGLISDRGINFRYATENATEKGEHAAHMMGINNMLGDIQLAMVETEGEA